MTMDEGKSPRRAQRGRRGGAGDSMPTKIRYALLFADLGRMALLLVGGMFLGWAAVTVMSVYLQF